MFSFLFRILDSKVSKVRYVGLFYVIDGRLFLHRCSLPEAQKHGDLLIYPYSHIEVWDNYYNKPYGVEYDFFPRGRIDYSTAEQAFSICHDRCIRPLPSRLEQDFAGEQVRFIIDEHYCCHSCAVGYTL